MFSSLFMEYPQSSNSILYNLNSWLGRFTSMHDNIQIKAESLLMQQATCFSPTFCFSYKSLWCFHLAILLAVFLGVSPYTHTSIQVKGHHGWPWPAVSKAVKGWLGLRLFLPSTITASQGFCMSQNEILTQTKPVLTGSLPGHGLR